MEQLQTIIRARLRHQRPLGPEPDVAPGVEIQPRQRLGQGGPRLVGGGCDVARATHHLLEAEARLRRHGGLRLLGEQRDGSGRQAQRGGEA